MKPEQKDKKAKDKAGIGQSDEEKGIASKEEQEQKRQELLDQGKATKAARFTHLEDEEEDKPPLHLKDDED